MKLKPIPNNIVVHTPTEAEAKELLAILHENGYKWYCSGKEEGWENFGDETCYRINTHDNVYHTCDRECYETTCKYCRLPVLTLADFKKRYCEEKKPQPKFKVGDLVRMVNVPASDFNNCVGKVVFTTAEHVNIKFPGSVRWAVFPADFVEPYTEPETKPTEDMETKGKEQGETGNNPDNSQLNLCELLKGHEGEVLYSPIVGDCTLTAVKDYIYVAVKDHPSYCFFPDGRREPSGDVVLYPSRALYEQYPLDAVKAWRIWDEKHYIHRLAVRLYSDDEIKKVLAAEGKGNVSGLLSCICRFKALADRDKCVKEIKAVIEKYNK